MFTTWFTIEWIVQHYKCIPPSPKSSSNGRMNIATQHPHTWCIIMLNTSTQLQHCHCKFSQALYNVDNTQVRPMIISTSHRSSLLVLTLGMLAPSLTILTMNVLYSLRTCLMGANIEIHIVLMFFKTFKPFAWIISINLMHSKCLLGDWL